MRVRIIANPHAGGGRARREFPAIRDACERAGVACEIAETTGPRHATELARAATAEGVDLIAAVGGDGTINEVAQAYVDQDGRPVTGPELAIIPFGTGGDFRRSFGWEQDLEQAVRRITHGRPRALDLAWTTFRGEDGAASGRAFINVGSAGISGVVTRAVNQSRKWLGGRVTFYAASFKATLAYTNRPVQLSIDGHVVFQGPMYLVAIANGMFFGGGMRIAPNADPHDGVLDCVLHGDLSRVAAVSLTSGMYDGSHVRRAKAQTWRGRHFELVPWLVDTNTPLELDGETPGHLPLTVAVLPAAVQLRI
jgi:YegS/Rv2252/BmrU family lipid kinase